MSKRIVPMPFPGREVVPSVVEKTSITPEETQKLFAKPVVEEVVSTEKPIYRTYEDFDFQKLQMYGGLDSIATSEILARLMPKMLEEPELRMVVNGSSTPVKVKGSPVIKSYLEVIHPCNEFIIDLEINGMVYDVDRNRQISSRMVTEVDELEDKIFTQLGKKLNLDSGLEVAQLLYVEKGFTPPFHTKSGDDATDGAALMTLAGLAPLGGIYTAPEINLQFLADMAKRRDINSVHNTFIKNYIDDFVKGDGRIHPSYNMHGTSSFRITGDRPNLTQLPRPKHYYNVRECYTIPPGFVFVTWDFSSAEVKVLAAICKDPNMLKAIEQGLDFHSFSASAMHGIPYDEFIHILEDKSHPDQKKYKNLRQVAKVLTFSILYGSSAGGIAFQLNISKDEAERLMALYFKAYPGVKKYIEESHNMALWNQKIWTPFGQYKHEYVAQPVFKKTAAYNAGLRNAQNVRIQSTTSTMGLVVFSHLNKALYPTGARSTCTVYDSLEVECPMQKVAEVVELGFQYMDDWPVQEFDWLDLPIGVECEIGYNWGQVETVKRGTSQVEMEAMLERLAAKKTW